MSETFNWDSPIIIIGAGRSGSTLLTSILGEHSQVYMVGETAFLLNRLWQAFFAEPDYVATPAWGLLQDSRPEWRSMLWHDFYNGPLTEQMADGGSDALRRVEAAERDRLARCLGRFVTEAMVPPPLRRKLWVLQEIWNGSTSFPYGWEVHERAFPTARYVQVVRHPWTWMQSYFLRMEVVPTAGDVVFALRNWVSMTEMAGRQQRHGDRYALFQYEQVAADPTPGIHRLLDFAGLADEPGCHLAGTRKYGESPHRIVLPTLTEAQVESVGGLLALMERFGYTPPASDV